MMEKKMVSMKQRIVMKNLCMVAAVLLLMFGLILNTLWWESSLTSAVQLEEQVANGQQYIDRRLSEQGGGTLPAEAESYCNRLSEIMGLRVQIYAADGGLLGDSGETRTVDAGDDVRQALAGGISHSFERVGEMSYISGSAPLLWQGRQVGVLRYLSRFKGHSVVNNIVLQLFMFCAAVLPACYFISIWIAHRALRPAVILHKWLESIKNDDIKTVPEVYDEEYKELAATLSSLVHSNKRSLTELELEKERQNLFFNSATHQLKTPLTSIIGYSEIIKRMSDDPDVQQSADYIEQAGKSLLYTVEDIINISRYQKTEYEFVPDWFCLRELCLDCLNHMQPRLSRSGIRIELRCLPQQVFFDYGHTKEAVLNIIDNAIIYSGGDLITIELDTFPIRLMISDNGSGIGPDEINKVFEPFYRPSKSSSRGSGLGLSICKAIMTAQHGDLEINSALGGGTCAILYFEEKDVSKTTFQNMKQRI